MVISYKHRRAERVSHEAEEFFGVIGRAEERKPRKEKYQREKFLIFISL